MERNTPSVPDIPHLSKAKKKVHLAIELTQFTSETVPAMSTGYGK
jgi:hypothetical protein